MLYLDYEKKKGEWTPNRHGGNVNFESVAFIRQLNRTVKHLYPDVLMIADECGSFKNTTGTDEGGLGFDLAWDPTPLKAALSIVKSSMTSRKYSELNDTISYHRECLMLPLSHISLSLASRSLIDNTAGAYELRFAQLKSFFTYAMTLPSKKLSFMSNEFGQFAPWDHAKSIEWFMLNYDTHRRLRDFTADLGALYLTRNELWEADASSEGCALISASSQEHRWASYKRINKAGDELLVILSLAEDVKHITGLPIANGTYRILSSSEYVKYGGNRSDDIKAVTIQDGSLHLYIFPFESLILERVTN